jgi:hypothetical protein
MGIGRNTLCPSHKKRLNEMKKTLSNLHRKILVTEVADGKPKAKNKRGDKIERTTTMKKTQTKVLPNTCITELHQALALKKKGWKIQDLGWTTITLTKGGK